MTRFFRSLSFWLLVISEAGLPFLAVAQNPPARPIRYATEYDWSMRPSEELGAGTVSLASCPPGVKGNEPEYWVLINGSEPARVTGGTCAGDGRPGTLQFASKRSHVTGDTLSSASGGLQEAIIAARYAPTNPPGTPQSGMVVVPPKELKAFARVSIRSSASPWISPSAPFLNAGWTTPASLSATPQTPMPIGTLLINPRGRPRPLRLVKSRH